MSPQDQIKQRIRVHTTSDPKLLHFFEPPVPTNVKRHLVMSADVRDAIRDEFSDETDRHAAMLDFFLRFAEHDVFLVSEDPAEHPPNTEIARNSPVSWEFWDFRVYADTHATRQTGNKGIRVCGAFACKDTFVALTWDYRENIGDQFAQFVADTRHAWDQLFFPLTPHQGSNVHEYLSNAHVAR